MSNENKEQNQSQDTEFEQMMEQRIRENFNETRVGSVEISDERLKEMSKRLPAWSLEPPYSFLK